MTDENRWKLTLLSGRYIHNDDNGIFTNLTFERAQKLSPGNQY